jgi:hypothetical protein
MATAALRLIPPHGNHHALPFAMNLKSLVSGRWTALLVAAFALPGLLPASARAQTANPPVVRIEPRGGMMVGVTSVPVIFYRSRAIIAA